MNKRAIRSALATAASRGTLVAPALGLSLGAWLAFAHPKRRGLALTTLGASVGFALARWQLARLFVEEAPFTIEFESNGIQIRHYEPRVEAATTIKQVTWKQGLSQGVIRLESYVCGANDDRSNLAATSPVAVGLGRAFELEGSSSADRTLALPMPKGRLLESLPTPNDDRIHLREVPGRRMAALRFNGSCTEDMPCSKRDELLARVRGVRLEARGEVVFAAYDGPSTLPWLRRNEVIVEIAP